jgi:hypothetical protein
MSRAAWRTENDPAGALALLGDALDRWAPGATIIALGWATVELDRAERELRGTTPGEWVSEPDTADELLGAVARPLRAQQTSVPPAGWLGGADRVVLLEPSTEGRIAACLARHGEGPCVVWAHLPGTSLPAGAPLGPFGPERLESRGPAWGPHVLLVGGAGATIAS